MSNPFDLSMYALVGVMAIIAVASTWYPKDRKINFYIFLLSIVTFLGLVVLGFLNWFIEGSAYGALVSCVCIIFLCMTRLRLIVYRYNVKSSVKRIVASVKEGKRVAFIAHQKFGAEGSRGINVQLNASRAVACYTWAIWFRNG